MWLQLTYTNYWKNACPAGIAYDSYNIIVLLFSDLCRLIIAIFFWKIIADDYVMFSQSTGEIGELIIIFDEASWR
jgi:hypothetical protein